ncbi:putative Ubiquitin Carboxyl-Terminal Hydrolase Faf-Y [Manis pentadactyla]|nr:putative Ubiquitin Carboxyl-Terminal Hydrolase Faf-Y [Manis pentadactyla]
MGAGRYLGIEPQNEVPVNDLWNSLPSLYYLLSHVSSPGTFSKRSEGKNKGPESRSGSSSQLLTLSPKQASRCFLQSTLTLEEYDHVTAAAQHCANEAHATDEWEPMGREAIPLQEPLWGYNSPEGEACQDRMVRYLFADEETEAERNEGQIGTIRFLNSIVETHSHPSSSCLEFLKHGLPHLHAKCSWARDQGAGEVNLQQKKIDLEERTFQL